MTKQHREAAIMVLAVVGAYIIVRWLLKRAYASKEKIPPSAYGGVWV